MEYATLLISVLFFFIAFLYACVGHAGASGYIAVMAFMSIAPSTIKPAALLLNILVASIASVKFYRAGAFSKHIFFPLIATSIPLAYLGGLVNLPGSTYKILIGFVLIYASMQSFYLYQPLATTAKDVSSTEADVEKSPRNIFIKRSFCSNESRSNSAPKPFSVL